MRTLVAAIVLALAVVAGDTLAARWAEGRVEQVASARLGVPATARVPGRPFLLHVARGRLPVVRVEARDVTLGTGGTLRSLWLTLHGVRVDPRTFLQGRLPEAEGGAFSATADVAALAGLAGVGLAAGEWTVTDGAVELTIAGRRVRLEPAVVDGAVVLRAPGGVELALPSLGLGAVPWRPVVERVNLTAEGLELRGRLDG